MRLTAPNLLSLSRLVLAALFVFARTPAWQATIVLLAASTDFIDGWIARHYGQRTKSGELLDPITDKLFVLTVLITLAVRKQLGLTPLLILLTRDIYNTAGYILARARRWPVRFAARFSGKLVTTLQITTVIALLLVPRLTTLVLWVTFAVSLYSIADYTSAAVRDLRRPREAA